MRVFAALDAPDFRPSRTAIVSGPPPAGQFDLEWGTRSVRTLETLPVETVKRTAVSVTMRADAGGAPAYLIISQVAYPGWKATLDGKAIELRVTDGAITGLSLPSGKHVITLTYHPDSYRIGVFLSLLACGILMAGGGFELITSARKSS